MQRAVMVFVGKATLSVKGKHNFQLSVSQVMQKRHLGEVGNWEIKYRLTAYFLCNIPVNVIKIG